MMGVLSLGSKRDHVAPIAELNKKNDLVRYDRLLNNYNYYRL